MLQSTINIGIGLMRNVQPAKGYCLRSLSLTSYSICEKGIGVLILSNDAGKNSLSKAFILELNDLFAKLRENENIRSLIIKSNVPKIFCAGADLKERLSMPDNEVGEFVSSLRQTCNFLDDLPFPTIAAIEGAALGGGLELAMACDIRYAGQNSLLGLPETALAILPGAGGTQRLPRLVGLAKAKELIYTGKRLKGIEAEKIGSPYILNV